MRRFSLKSFFRREDGTLSVEAVFALPMLVWVMLAMIVFFDAFRQVNAGQKATFTIADMLSREDVNPINGAYLTAALETFEFLTEGNGNNALRVTVVAMSAPDPITGNTTRSCVWSKGVGGASGHTDLAKIEPRLPDMTPGSQMIIVEGEYEWSPGFTVGLSNYRFGETALSTPRFTSQLRWDGTPICGGTV